MDKVSHFRTQAVFSEDIRASLLMEKASKMRPALVEKYIRYAFPPVSRSEAADAIGHLASKDPCNYTEKERETYFRLCPEIKNLIKLREDATVLAIEATECN